MDSNWNKSSFNGGNIISVFVDISFVILGVTLNIITILVVLKGKKFGNKMKTQLVNLAIADIFSSLCVPVGGSVKEYIHLPFPNNVTLCRVYKYFGYTVFSASILSHMAIALERFVAVYFPFRMINYTRSKVAVVTMSIWVAAMLLNLEYYFMSDIYPNPLKLHHFLCFTDFSTPFASRLSEYFGAKLFVPAFIIFGSYSLIVFRLKCRKRVGVRNLAKSQQVTSQVIFMLSVDSILAVAVYTPYFFFATIMRYGEHHFDKEKVVEEVLFNFIHMNCFITPIVSFIFSRNFRADMKEVFCSNSCKARSRQPPASLSKNIIRKSVYSVTRDGNILGLYNNGQVSNTDEYLRETFIP